MRQPTWSHLNLEPINYQSISYYSAPQSQPKSPKHLNEIDPEILRAYNKLGISLAEQERLSGVAVDAVFDSVSVATTCKEILSEVGVIFVPFLKRC